MDAKFEKIQRKKSEALDVIIGKPFPVLNDGFVRVIEYMGTDQTIVQAARVSYGEGTKKVREDRNLIRYLLRHAHTSPFEMCDIMFHIRVPMDCWRQWIRHRTASVNEYSTRYSLAIEAAQTTLPGEWRLQATSNRQGSEGCMSESDGQKFTSREHELQTLARDIYNERIEAGVAREQARKDLPLCTYTEAYWKIDLNNLLHFLRLRMDSHAQYEIRSYAETIGYEIVKRWLPLVWEAFEDYALNSISLSNFEQEIMGLLATQQSEKAIEILKEKKWLRYTDDNELKLHYERLELEEKLNSMNIAIPWL